jgi:hypothetical protein
MFKSPSSAVWTYFRATAAFLLTAMALSAPSASAGPGYELDAAKPSIALGGEVPHGVAVDQVSQNLYVTELTTDINSGGHGQVEQFDSNGVATANSPFVTGGEDYFAGVAVNPVTQGIYAYQTQLSTPFGTIGVSKMNTFSSTGVVGSSFTPANSIGPQIAADPSGRVYFPNDSANTVQVFDSSGTLKETIACSGCLGGAFSEPSAVARDSAGNLYVVDLASGGRVIKFEPSGGSYVYDSVLQSGKGAAGVGVDPASNDVFVGDLEGNAYHVVAYDATGTQFDDFGDGVIGPPYAGAVTAGHIAANATTHKVYVADSGAAKVWIFDRIASIPAPSATTSPTTPIGQVDATLKATVNPHGHRLIDCHFEYTTDADFQANGFANAVSVPCSSKPGGTAGVALSVKATGLTPGTAYDDRIVAAGNGGPATGSAQAFTTLPPLSPDVTTGSASPITQTTATLGGSVNPRGGVMSDCHFEYTTDADFQANGFASAVSKACLVVPEGTANAPVSTKLTGLTPDTSYRFRVVATNNSGTSSATDQVFATLAETCATNPALCPPEPPTESIPTPPLAQPIVSPPARKRHRCRRGFKKKRVHGKVRCVRIKKRH